MFLRLVSEPTVLVIAAMVLLMGLLFPTTARALGGEPVGARTPRVAGFAAFEPQRQLDPFGVLFLLLLGFGWPRAVPVNPRNYRGRGRGEAWVWLAGIGSYLVAAFVSLLVAAVFRSLGSSVLFFSFEVAANYALLHAVINLVPLLPLDMGRAALAWGHPDVRRVIMQVAQFGILGFMVFFFVLNATGVIGRVMLFFDRLFSGIIGLIPGL